MIAFERSHISFQSSREADHLGDHREGNRGGEVLDEVGIGARREAGERFVDDATDRRALGLEGLRGETQREQIAVLATGASTPPAAATGVQNMRLTPRRSAP